MAHRSFNILTMTAVLFAVAGSALAAITDHTWTGPSSGTQLWDNNANWTPSAAPADSTNTPNNDDSTNGERALIGNATADRDILSPDSDTSFLALSSWTQSTAAVVNRIILQADLHANRQQSSTWNNTSGDAANMVLDLAGNTFSYNNTSVPSIGVGGSGYTVTSSAVGGVWEQRGFGGMNAALVVGPNVTLVATVAGTSQLNGVWDDATTFHITAMGDHFVSRLPTGGISHLVIGDPANVGATNMIGFVSQFTSQIRGDVTIHSYSGAVGGDASDFTFDPNTATSSNVDLRVGGTWIDAATDSTGYLGAPISDTIRRTITFNGSPVTANTVSIGRTGLVNDFAVGRNVSDTGYVALAQDLTTTGRFSVRDGSHLVVGDHTVTAGSFVSNGGAIYTYTFGADTGLIEVTDDNGLTLDPFTINIVRGDGWVHGSDVILMTYVGTLGGAPAISFGSVPNGFDYDTFETADGVVMLTNVVLPEPLSSATMLAGGLILLRRRRR